MTTDAATTTALRIFHLRVLFPHVLALPKTDPRRIHAPPRMTRSAAIDSELYTYIALLVRDFIHPWYRAVTNDQDFCTELVKILTAVIQELEQRLCNQVDWTELILLSAPKLVTLHYEDYRRSKTRMHMSHGGSNMSLEQLFHGMQPHFALQSDEKQQAEYLRALTDAILNELLAPENYGSDCVRHLLREILSNLVLANLINLLSDPHTINTIICKLLGAYGPTVDYLEATGRFAQDTEQSLQITPPTSPSTRIATAVEKGHADDQRTENKSATTPPQEKADKEDLPSQLQRLQEKRRQQGDEIVDAGKGLDEKKHERRRFSFGYITLQVMLAPIRALWLHIMATLTHSQERYHQIAQHKKRTRHARLVEPSMQLFRVIFQVDDRPILQSVWYMLGMFLWPLIRVVGGGLLVDKFLEQTILHFLSQDHLVFYLQLGRGLLWPDGVFLRKSTPPTAAEKQRTRIRAERLLTVAFPSTFTKVMFDTDDITKVQSEVHEILEPLQNQYINKHLMFLLVDLVASKILPELVDSDPSLS